MVKKSRLSAKKIIVIGITSVLFIAIITRAVLVAVLNRRFTPGMSYQMGSDYRAEYEYYEDGYYYYYSPASFFNTSCYITLCTVDSMKINITSTGENTTNGMAICLYIWPDLDKSYKMGVVMEQYDSEHSINEKFYIDSKLNYIVNTNDEDQIKLEKNLLEEYHDEIEELVNRAVTKWDIL
ncbi:MAG: hypothetical protein ACI39R_08745 [Lachnospiraceae bacterium]